MKRAESEMSQSKEKSKKRSKKNIFLSIFGILVVFGAIGGVYYWQSNQVNALNSQISSKDKVNKSQQENIKNLNKKIAELELKIKNDTNSKVSDNLTIPHQEPVSTIDSDFVAVSPQANVGFLSRSGPLKFTWTPHKDATFYVVEYKLSGQMNYPTASEKQIVKYPSSVNQPNTMNLTIDFNPGTPTTYQWRISAKKIVDGKEVILQSTPETYLTISA